MVCPDDLHIGFFSLWLVESLSYEGLLCGWLFPEQRMAFRSWCARRQGPVGNLEGWLSLSRSHPVCASDELGSGHSEAAIDKIPAILLRHHNIVLLPQIPYDVVDHRGR
jgi:hypothetical protein